MKLEEKENIIRDILRKHTTTETCSKHGLRFILLSSDWENLMADLVKKLNIDDVSNCLECYDCGGGINDEDNFCRHCGEEI